MSPLIVGKFDQCFSHLIIVQYDEQQKVIAYNNPNVKWEFVIIDLRLKTTVLASMNQIGPKMFKPSEA